MCCEIYNFTRELKSALIHLYGSVRKMYCNASLYNLRRATLILKYLNMRCPDTGGKRKHFLFD